MGERVLVSRSGKIVANILGHDFIPERGEIILFRVYNNDFGLMKRTIGLPGERIVIKDNVITIYNKQFPDGFVLALDFDSPLPEFPVDEAFVDQLIGEDEIFVIGDKPTAK